MACVQETDHQSIQAGHLKGSDAATAGNLLYFSCVTIALPIYRTYVVCVPFFFYSQTVP